MGSNLKAPAHRPVLVVFFEDLKADPAPQLARMLEFLEVPSSPEIINATVMVCNYSSGHVVELFVSETFPAGWLHFLLSQPH